MRQDGKVSSNEFWNTPLLGTYDSRMYYSIDEVLSKAKEILAKSVHQTHTVTASIDLSTTQQPQQHQLQISPMKPAADLVDVLPGQETTTLTFR